MTSAPTANSACADYLLWFHPSTHEGRALAFPCDAQGRVDMDALSERARNDYLFARAAVGREFSTPVCRRATDR
jgi:hypothetical protein